MKSKAFRSAFPHTLPVMAGYLFLGMGFGILLESNGYSFIWAFFMSIFIYAGSMQYVAIDLLASGASLISTAIMTLMIQGTASLLRSFHHRQIQRYRKEKASADP